jgi:hypothetical protein
MAKERKKRLIDTRLAAYSAAAAGMLAVAPAADAAVQYSGPRNIVINSGNPTVLIDLNNDGNNDFQFALSSSSSYFYMSLAPSGRSAIAEHVHHRPANLPNNYPVRSALINPNYWTNSVSSSTLAGPNNGNFKGKKGFLGVKFNTSGGLRYGWVQFDGSSWPTQGVIVDWAYEDTGAPISAGNTGTVAPVGAPTVDLWGLLILITLLAGASLKMLKKDPLES